MAVYHAVAHIHMGFLTIVDPRVESVGVCSAPLHSQTGAYMLATKPPSTRRFTPVINDAASEARTTTAEATSSGVPGRPSSNRPTKPSTACCCASPHFL